MAPGLQTTNTKMDFLKAVFEVFSRRPQAPVVAVAPVTQSFRNRVLLLCRDVIGPTGYLSEFWEQIHQKLEYLHGTPELSAGRQLPSRVDDVLAFLAECESEHFLDFVEYIFRVDAFWHVQPKDDFVAQINSFLEVDDLPYFLTDYVKVEEPGSYRGAPTAFIKVASYPHVIMKEHRLSHVQAIEPALSLLTDPAFASANAEFLEGMEDYRHKDYGDCLTKCGSAFESVLKILCDQHGWAYKPTDTVSRLLDLIVSQTDLDSFFIQPLMLVATLRNRLSKAHGAGSGQRVVQPHVAQFAINATAAAILLVTAETRAVV
jgi:hypothetical protein